ncbi:hypothetical protein CS063_07340 [Sporanaerobium hydrogeniformans]|uniref:Uncharacterized protein n=1 Tax=Sporanaerobium hydrogeniformans TaxID=3072179 RepID=A0AC61DE40_9FIRM|nr:YlmH/Sll1252 family protein [Sporanaerobium hydrogeniformans]PHV71135.1 hypothetical protein CS063_07340 [Sporanaerobium hydrogeniformans]
MKDVLQYVTDPKEKLFLKTLIEYIARVEKNDYSLFTNFHDGLWMKQVVQKYLGASWMSQFAYFGGYKEAQRQILGVLASYDNEPEVPICCLKLTVKTGIGKPLSHRDYLGALLGLGLERDLIGDIIVQLEGAYIVVKANIADYIACSLTQIGRYTVSEMQEVPMSAIPESMQPIKVIRTTVASLRADTVLAAGFGLSRNNCAKLIQGDKATCNGMKVSVSTPLKEGDILTLRGYGKMKLKEINGQTKKERFHICIEKYI